MTGQPAQPQTQEAPGASGGGWAGISVSETEKTHLEFKGISLPEF
jgi:hypothetical protein